MSDLKPGHAYYLESGEEVLYSLHDDVPTITFPRVREWPPRPSEPLAGRTLLPRIVECEEGHRYHLRVECFPVVYPCPICEETHDVAAHFRGDGFTLSHTGGGCTAWEFTAPREAGGEWLVMVTDDASAPRSSADLFAPVVGVYEMDEEGEYVDDEGWWWSGGEERSYGSPADSVPPCPTEVRERVDRAIALFQRLDAGHDEPTSQRT